MKLNEFVVFVMYEKLLVSSKNILLQSKRTNTELKNKLMEFFVNRLKLQERIQKDIKPKSVDVSYLTSQEYFKQQHCYHEHTNPQMKGYYKKQFGFDESDFLFIEDGGINNEW